MRWAIRLPFRCSLKLTISRRVSKYILSLPLTWPVKEFWTSVWWSCGRMKVSGLLVMDEARGIVRRTTRWVCTYARRGETRDSSSLRSTTERLSFVWATRAGRESGFRTRSFATRSEQRSTKWPWKTACCVWMRRVTCGTSWSEYRCGSRIISRHLWNCISDRPVRCRRNSDSFQDRRRLMTVAR